MSDNPSVSALARFQEHLDAAIEAVATKPKQKTKQSPKVDTWEDVLRDLELKPDARHNIVQAVDASGGLEWRVRSSYLVTVIGIAPERAPAVLFQRRLGTVMRTLGWTGPKNIKFGRTQAKGYCRPAAEDVSP